MTEHLPECWAKHESDPPAWCICDELRACEERVKGPLLALIEAGGNAYSEGYEWGRGEALEEAREAIAAIVNDRDAVVWFERFYENPEDLEEVTVMVELNRAIAALPIARKVRP